MSFAALARAGAQIIKFKRLKAGLTNSAIITVLTVTTLSTPSLAATVFNNGSASTNDGFRIDGTNQAYDDFSIAIAALVTGVGFYFQNFHGITGWDQNVSYNFYADNAGTPGALLASGAGQNVVALDSGLPWCCGGNAFLVTFDLQNAFLVAPGTTYWLSLTNANTTSGASFWVTSGSGNGRYGQPPNGLLSPNDDFAYFLNGDFVSSTPIPAALPLFASGLGVMGLLGWRRKRKAALGRNRMPRVAALKMKIASAVIGAALVAAAMAYPVQAATISSFETPNIGLGANAYNSNSPLFPDPALGSPTTDGITFVGLSGVQANGSAFGFTNAPDGTQAAFLQTYYGNSVGSISFTSQSTSLTLTPYLIYELVFQAESRPSGGGNSFTVTVNGNTTAFNAPSTANWSAYTLYFTAVAGLNTFGFSIDSLIGVDRTIGIDFINIEAAPQLTPLPAALPLFATGLGALGLLGWRRKRKAAALAV